MKHIFLLFVTLFFLFGNAFSVYAVYDLALKKTTLNNGPYKVGDTVEFTIEVFNQGDEDASNIQIVDYISPGLGLSDITWTQTGTLETGLLAEYEFVSIPAGETRTKNIIYTITEASESHISSHTEISRDDGDDCDSTPDRDILNDGLILDDYLGVGCESDDTIGEDDHDSEVITVKQRKKSRFNFIVRSGPNKRNYVVVTQNRFYPPYYIPVEDARDFINIIDEEPIIIDIDDYEFRENEIQDLEDFSGDLSTYNIGNNNKLKEFGTSSSGSFITVAGEDGNISFFNTLVTIAQSIKNLFYAIAGVFFLIITLRLLFAGNTDEELSNFKKGIIWITVGLIVMQLALSFVTVAYDQGVSGEVGENIISQIVQPMLLLLQTLTSIFFIAVAIFAFYRLVTANGNEEAVKSGKMTIVYGVIGFMIVRFAGSIVNAFYGQVNCSAGSGESLVSTSEKICRNDADMTEGVQIIMSVIVWANSFVALVVMLMIIYAGFQVLLSGGDEERVKKGKQSIIYIIIGLAILALNYLILTFFIPLFTSPAASSALPVI